MPFNNFQNYIFIYESTYRYDTLESGDYEMCLDNKFTRFASKTVYLEVSIDVDSVGYKWSLVNEKLEKDRLERDTIRRLKVS